MILYLKMFGKALSDIDGDGDNAFVGKEGAQFLFRAGGHALLGGDLQHTAQNLHTSSCIINNI